MTEPANGDRNAQSIPPTNDDQVDQSTPSPINGRVDQPPSPTGDETNGQSAISMNAEQAGEATPPEILEPVDEVTATGDDEHVDLSMMIPAMGAVLILERVLGGSLLAKRELADRMRDGRLKTYVAEAWDSGKAKVAEAWKETIERDDPKRAYIEAFELSAHVWRDSIEWTADQEHWRWPSGRFSTVLKRAPTLRYMLKGVHFDTAQIDALATRFATKFIVNENLEDLDFDQVDIVHGGNADPKNPKKAMKRSVGAQERTNAWAQAFLEIMRLKEQGILFGPTIYNRAGLARHLANHLGQSLYARSLRPMCAVVWDALERERAPRNADTE